MGKQTLLIYLKHALRYKRYVAGVIISMPITLLAHQILPPIIASRILNRLSSGDYIRGQFWQSFGTDITQYAVLVFIGGTLLWRITIYFDWRLEMLVQRDLARRMFNHYMDLDSNFHANSFGGSLVSRTNKFVSAYMRIADTFIFQVYSLALMLIVTAIVMWSRSQLYVFGIFAFSFTFIAISIWSTKLIRSLQSVAASAENKQTGVLADMITNILAVKSFAADRFEQSRFDDVSEHTHMTMRKVMRATLTKDAFFGSITSSMQILALAIAAAAVVLYDAEIGSVFLILYYTNNLSVRLFDFSQHGLRNINRGLGDAQEATMTLLKEPSVLDPKQPEKVAIKNGHISFTDVVFSHDQNTLFKNFNLTIAPGEKVGLVGPSGSGKSTITKLLLRFVDIQEGSICIDGQNIAHIKQSDLRANISYVPQEPLLFHRSLKENIMYGKTKASQKEVVAAAKKAHAHEFISTLTEKYETLVGERGVKLSGGQKQRIAIARSMIKDAPILILDEATSALDSESEILIQDALWKLMEGKSAIVIAHRLSTIQKMDRIIVLDKGTIVEEGSHKELLKKKGHYARLWAHQSGGFLED